MEESKYMKILEKAVGQLAEGYTLSECIAEICEKEEVDVLEMAEWIKGFKSLIHTIESSAIKYRAINKEDIYTTISISELF